MSGTPVEGANEGFVARPSVKVAARAGEGRWDAIVVGGGHNGLVCAAYLAGGGLRTIVLERRDQVGGCLATSQLAPGARVPALAHTVGRLAGVVARDLKLASEGLRLVQPAARVTSLAPGRPAITLWGDATRTAAGLREVSDQDAAAWVPFDREVRALAGALWRIMSAPPPDLSGIGLADVLSLLRVGWGFRGLGPAHGGTFLRVLAQPIADWLEDRFEDDGLRALLATRALRYTRLGLHDAGSSAVLLADSAGNDGGAPGETVYARGGPGALAAALASAARRAGATIRTGAQVAGVLDHDGTVAGVRLADGEVLEAPRVIGGIDPRRLLLDLVDPEALGPQLGWQAGNLRARGVTAKVNLALATLPVFDGLGGDDAASRLRGRIVIAPSTAYLDAAADAAKYGRPSEEPWLEATIPSLVDPLLVDGAAVSGVRHVMSVIVQSMPVDLREGAWDGRGDAIADATLRVLETVSPGISGTVVAREVRSPADLERDPGLSGGHPMHLEPGLDQWFAWRPMLGAARYRLVLDGLYLCGAGAHPGGGVTGMPGRLAARAVLADARAGAARAGTARAGAATR